MKISRNGRLKLSGLFDLSESAGGNSGLDMPAIPQTTDKKPAGSKLQEAVTNIASGDISKESGLVGTIGGAIAGSKLENYLKNNPQFATNFQTSGGYPGMLQRALTGIMPNPTGSMSGVGLNALSRVGKTPVTRNRYADMETAIAAMRRPPAGSSLASMNKPAGATAAPAGATNPIGSSMGIPELQGHISNLDPQKRQELLNWLIQNGAQ